MKAFSALVLALIVFLTGCDAPSPEADQEEARELLVFCGTTMIDPVMELSRMAEKEFKVVIKMTYGGSQDLAKAIEVNRLGDIYLPGTRKYVDEMNARGLVAGSRQVGVNQIAFFVQKGNPKKISGDLATLIDPSISVAIGHQDLGSVGREAKRILEKKGIYDAVVSNAAFMASDSKGMTRGLRDKRVDLVMNWRSVITVKDNAEFMDEVPIEPGYAEKHPLVMARLVYSRHPELADKFMALCASETGRQVFRKYGF